MLLCVCVCVFVCVGADADIMFTTHLRNVCGGHSLKAPLTDIVYLNIKVLFKFTDEANLLTLSTTVAEAAPKCVNACACVPVWLWRDWLIGGGEMPPMFKGWRMEEIQSGGIRTVLKKRKEKSYIVLEPFDCLLADQGKLMQILAWFHLQVSLRATFYRSWRGAGVDGNAATRWTNTAISSINIAMLK